MTQNTASSLADLTRAHFLLGQSIEDLRRVSGGNYSKEGNASAFADADRLMIEADGLTYRACEKLGVPPHRIGDTSAGGADLSTIGAVQQQLRAVNHINRLHVAREALRAIVLKAGGDAIADDAPPSAIEARHRGKDAEAVTTVQKVIGCLIPIIIGLIMLATHYWRR